MPSFESPRLAGHLSEVTRAGLPLADGLAALAEELPYGRFRTKLRSIAQQLEMGASLEAALAAQDAPADLKALIRAAERTGHLGEVLGQYVTLAGGVRMLRHRTTLALVYPVFLMVMAMCIFTFSLVVIVPGFKGIFEDFAIELPGITWLLLELSSFAVNYGLWLFLAAVIVAVILLLAALSAEGAALLRQIGSGIPLLAPLLRWSAMARFSHLLGVLVEGEVPLPEAFELAGEGSGDPEIRRASHRFAAALSSGMPMRGSPYSELGFPASFVQSLNMEQHGQALPGALHATADMYEHRARVQSSFLVSISEPLIVVFTGAIIGFLIIALFLPLIKLLNSLA